MLIKTLVTQRNDFFSEIEPFLIRPIIFSDEKQLKCFAVNELIVDTNQELFDYSFYLKAYWKQKNELLYKSQLTLNTLRKEMEVPLESEDSLKIVNFFHKFENKVLEGSSLLSFFNMIKLEFESTASTIDPLYFICEDQFFSISVEAKSIKIISYLFSMFIQSKKNLVKESINFQSYKLLETFFNQSDVGLVVFNQNNELVIHNKAFRDLNILSQKVLSLQDKEKIEVEGKSFEVSVTSLEARFKLFSFKLSKGSYHDSQDEELGIITSSIAHEINNPIAGILSGVDALTMIDDNLCESSAEILQEIKKSALKSKNLVSTFLGFYKDKFSSLDTSSESAPIDQAFDLMRTRLIESELRLKLEFQGKSQKAMLHRNNSLWTMLFYLTLTSVINVILRDRLIRRRQHQSLDLKVVSPNKGDIGFDLSDESLNQLVFNDLNSSAFFHYLLQRGQCYLAYEESTVLIRNL